MIRLRRLTAFLLMTVWLTATQHCALEAAGVWDVFASAENSCGCGNNHDCSDDACDVVEGGSVSTANTSIKVPAPALVTELQTLCVLTVESTAAEAPPVDFADALDRPRSWVPKRHFERRAAQPSRAPSLALA